ncbi:MAG: DUF5688 family protein [Bacillota bacterium]|nr:DUF5688 family protein [Bacillota bacterium]
MRNKEAVEKNIASYIEEDVVEDVYLHEVVKNNDQTCVGLIIKGKENISPIIYLKEFYEDMISYNEPFEKILENIGSMYCDSVKNVSHFIGREIDFSLEAIRDRITMRVSDMTLNKECLKAKVIYPLGNNLCMTFYVTLGDSSAACITESVAIANGYFEPEMLFEIASERASKEDPTMFGTIVSQLIGNGAQPLETLTKDNLGSDQMYVLTNASAQFGAAALWQGNTMSRIAYLLDDDYYVIPSSIHELLIISMADAPSVSNMLSMVSEVNGAGEFISVK